MMISCPACATTYDVPDSAIGPAGRRLKCAACGHRWHIDPPGADHAPAAAAAPPVAEAPPPAPVPPSAPAEPPLPIAPLLPLASDPAVAVPAPPPPLPAAAAPSAFDYQPPFAAPPSRGRAWLPWVLLALVLAGIAVFAAMRLVPGLAGNVGLARRAGSPLVISFTGEPVRRAMDSGNELLAVAGRVTNPTDAAQRVPEIRAELRDAQGRTVYDWTIGPPVARLAPGASAEFNAAEVDVPPAARTVHLRAGALPRV